MTKLHYKTNILGGRWWLKQTKQFRDVYFTEVRSV